MERKEMEQLLDGLDCSLRVSGMIGDSIMMGIVSSAMEEAYERILSSREGGLECLSDKYRFCGLAIMQLEWCLKFLQEEVDACVVQSGDERERLVGDLRLIRDRIRRRLEETELAIAEKERELANMNESESELRRALESKDEELRTLRSSLDLQRAIHGGNLEGKPIPAEDSEQISKDYEVELSALRTSCVHLIEEFSYKLREAKTHVSDVVQNLGVYYFSPLGSSEIKVLRRLEEEGSCEFLDRIVMETKSKYPRPKGGTVMGCFQAHASSDAEILRCTLRTGLDNLFEELGMTMSSLKRKLLLALDAANEAVNSSKAALDEQRLLWAFERETLHALLGSVLKDARRICGSRPLLHAGSNTPAYMNRSWSSLMKDFGVLRFNLERMAVQVDEQLGAASLVETPSHLKDPEKENSANHFESLEPNKEGNEEFTSKKKMQETTQVRAEIPAGKRSSFFQYFRELRSMKTRISKIILRLECFMEEESKLPIASDDFHSACKMQRWSFKDNLSGTELLEKENEVDCASSSAPWEVFNGKNFNSLPAGISQERKQLKESREDMSFKSLILEEMNAIFFEVLVRGMFIEFVDYKLEMLLREDMCRLVLSETMKELNCKTESCNFEAATVEKMDRIVFSNAIKDMLSTSLDFGNESHDSCSRNFFQSPCVDCGKMQEADRLLMSSETKEGLALDLNSEVIQPQMYLQWDSEISTEQFPNYFEAIDEDSAFCSVRDKLEKALKRLTMSKMQLRQLGSDFGVSTEEKGNIIDNVESHSDIKEDKDQSTYHHVQVREGDTGQILSVLAHLPDISRYTLDMELVVCDKIESNMLRLEDMNSQLNCLAQGQVSKLRKMELLYRKAFIRRCYNLQLAEAEVDLLGDEVDALIHLLEGVYLALEHYSPVIQCCPGIMDILKLIKEELFSDAKSTLTSDNI